MMRKITLEVKFDISLYKFSKFNSRYKCQCGALVESQAGKPEYIGSSYPVFFNFLQAWRVKRKITFVLYFQEALRHICVTAEA
jgi:hypothetical protein